MTLKSNYLVETGDWKLKELTDTSHDNPEDNQWYVLEHYIGAGTNEHISIPFDTVKASGSLIHLDYEDTRSATVAGSLSGLNIHKDNSDMPVEIAEKLQEIGPW